LVFGCPIITQEPLDQFANLPGFFHGGGVERSAPQGKFFFWFCI